VKGGGERRRGAACGGVRLGFTRYCHSQYCEIYIAIQGGRRETIYCATEWAVKGGGVGGGA